MKNIFGKTFILVLFIPIMLARAFYEAALGFWYGITVEFNDFVRLMKSPVDRW